MAYICADPVTVFLPYARQTDKGAAEVAGATRYRASKVGCCDNGEKIVRNRHRDEVTAAHLEAEIDALYPIHRRIRKIAKKGVDEL